ncbi:ABC transporter substrate-binding protein [Kocuria sp.]|uniref:ABC transporter substrate-binding protein n=1 Tax=Kocuria sp. TaxID=1871328 RepID=UPI0026DD16BC|nr:ABC transporter substrate-binding protein [Kocuria sp.]MDO4920143.1 ABC transporter substrate-binding protein [Kocuria sp.]
MQNTSFRRRLVPAVASGITLALVLGGCGSSDSGSGTADSSASESASSLLPQAEGTTQYPLTLGSPWGETTLEKRPERVAVLTADYDSEYLSMLGTIPVFAPDDVYDMVWMKNAFPQKVETLQEVPWGEPPYEAVAASRPDVIVATFNTDKAQYDRLKSIAPVVSVGGSGGREDQGETWRDRMLRVGEALDLRSAAERKITEHDEQLASLRAAHPEFTGRTVTYGVYYDTENGLNFNNAAGSNSERIFFDMGFEKNPNGEKFADDQKVSNEQLPLLDADVMLLADNSARQAGEKSTLRTITDLQLFKNLPVVQDGRTVVYQNGVDSYTVNGSTHDGNFAWALSESGPLAEQWAAQELAPYLSEAVQK